VLEDRIHDKFSVAEVTISVNVRQLAVLIIIIVRNQQASSEVMTNAQTEQL